VDESTFKLNIASLEKLYGHTLDPIVYKMYWNILRGTADNIFHCIIQKVVETFIPSSQVPFPVPAHFIKIKTEFEAIKKSVIEEYRPMIIDKSELPDTEYIDSFHNTWRDILESEEKKHTAASREF